MLLDTGSSESIINSTELDKIIYTELEYQKAFDGNGRKHMYE